MPTSRRRRLLHARCALLRQGRREAGKKFVKQLTAGALAALRGPTKGTEKDEDGDRKTRVVDGACIFAQPARVPRRRRDARCTGWRCERAAPLETKPDVCWQLPIRRTYDGNPSDATSYLEVHDRASTTAAAGVRAATTWTGTARRHRGARGEEPVYSRSAELTELMGQPAYDELVRLCDVRASTRRRASPCTPPTRSPPASPDAPGPGAAGDMLAASRHRGPRVAHRGSRVVRHGADRTPEASWLGWAVDW